MEIGIPVCKHVWFLSNVWGFSSPSFFGHSTNVGKSCFTQVAKGNQPLGWTSTFTQCTWVKISLPNTNISNTKPQARISGEVKLKHSEFIQGLSYQNGQWVPVKGEQMLICVHFSCYPWTGQCSFKKVLLQNSESKVLRLWFLKYRTFLPTLYLLCWSGCSHKVIAKHWTDSGDVKGQGHYQNEGQCKATNKYWPNSSNALVWGCYPL